MRVILLATMLLISAIPAAAGPNAGGTLVAGDADLVYITHDDFCVLGTAPAECAGLDTRLDGTSNLQFGVWKVWAAFDVNAHPRLAAVNFAISYDPDALVIVDSGPCGQFETRDGNWPASGSSVSVRWNTAQSGELIQVYWFAGYYDITSEHPVLFEVIADPVDGGIFEDDSPVPVVDPISGFGTLGFEMDGLVVCPAHVEAVGACCLADGGCILVEQGICDGLNGIWLGEGVECDPYPCGTNPTKELTWGRVKGLYR